MGFKPIISRVKTKPPGVLRVRRVGWRRPSGRAGNAMVLGATSKCYVLYSAQSIFHEGYRHISL